MLRLAPTHRYHGRRHNYRRPSGEHRARNNPFFRRPYIEIKELKPSRINKITLTRGDTDPKIFDGIVWTIQIHNKNRKLLSKHASNCRMEATQIRNGVDINTKISLSWKPDSLPTTCNFSSSVHGSDEYTQQLPPRYVGPLTGMGSPRPTILRGSTNELLFAFTFSESNRLYLISGPTASYEIISVSFNELDQHQFLIRFYSDEYEDTQGKLIRLEAASWDDIQMKRVKL